MPLAPAPSARLRDVSGIALIMALGVVFVLTIALSATIVLASESARHANNGNAGQKAYAIAEGGVNDTISRLAMSYPPNASPTTPDAGATVSSGGSARSPAEP